MLPCPSLSFASRRAQKRSTRQWGCDSNMDRCYAGCHLALLPALGSALRFELVIEHSAVQLVTPSRKATGFLLSQPCLVKSGLVSGTPGSPCLPLDVGA